MSIILEALKKASVNKNPRVAVAVETVVDNGFNMPRTMLMAFAAIATVGIVAFLTSNVTHDARPALTKTKPLAEGYAVPPAPSALKQETTPIGSFITKLSKPPLTLNGIVFGIGKPAAIIENKILEEGASIKGAKVVKIHSDSVEMVDEVTGQTFVLKVD